MVTEFFFFQFAFYFFKDADFTEFYCVFFSPKRSGSFSFRLGLRTLIGFSILPSFTEFFLPSWATNAILISSTCAFHRVLLSFFCQMKNGSLAKNVSLLPSFTEFFYIINFIINFFRLWLRPLILNLILPSFTEFFLLQQQQSAWLLQRLIVYRVLPSFFLKSGPFLISTVSTVEMVDWPTNFTEFYRVFLI